MSDRWLLKGTNYVNCNCAYGCPCQFSSPSTHGFCQAVANTRIEEGYFNDIKLDGLSMIYLANWPGEIAEGNGRCQVIIDERATDEQREALRKIAHGESTAPGATHFYVFGSTMSEFLETLYAPIDLTIDVDARRASVKVDGLVESTGSPCISPFDGSEARAGIHLPNGFEYTYAEMGSGTSKISADPTMHFEFSDSYGQFSQLHMNQDGVIRH